MKAFRSLLLIPMLVLLLGCVTKPMEEDIHAPPLMIAQNGDGQVTIIWDSEPGYVYTIYYQDTADADWKVLRTVNRVRGTGQELTANDLVNPNKPLRRYRILPEKQEAN